MTEERRAAIRMWAIDAALKYTARRSDTEYVLNDVVEIADDLVAWVLDEDDDE